MLILGLTGGIACGKSTISKTLKELGAVIIDGDEIAHSLTACGGAALPGLRQHFGGEVFLPDGSLNRKALGALVFGDQAARLKLDSFIQPLIRKEIEQQIAQARTAGVVCCVLDMPLLYEKDLDGLCDLVWCAYLPRNLQLTRLIERDGLTPEDAAARIDSQMPVEEKASRADVVIDTSGSIPDTSSMVSAYYFDALRHCGEIRN